MPDEDDQITLTPNSDSGEKEAAANKTMFDKTAYPEQDRPEDPLDVSEDLHGK